MLQLIDIEDVEFEFDEQLELYKEATNESIENQYVIQAIHKKVAFLFSPDGDLSKGWIVLCPSFHPLTRRKYVKAWLAYCKQGNAIVSFVDEVEHLAREIEAEYVEFSTEFKALTRLYERVGYKPAIYTYRKEL